MRNAAIQITFLGTGTSQGIPVIGCDCEVCQSKDHRDKRLRTALLVSTQQTTIVIDIGPDFRQQMLREGVERLDAIVITHKHNDHIIGLDDVRPFNFKQGQNMPIYATKEVQQNLQQRFAYSFEKNPYPGAPMLTLRTINKKEAFSIGDITLQPIEVLHGKLPVLGFRIGDFTYITDMKTITLEELKKVKGSKVLVLNALHQKIHHSHLNLEEALAFIEQIQPQKAYLLHLSHRMGTHKATSKLLPPNVFIAYDGLMVSNNTLSTDNYLTVN